jgi:hypothetical protein
MVQPQGAGNHRQHAGQLAINLRTAVGRARVGRDAVRWQGATTLRAHAREEEQRRQRTVARLNRVRSALTRMVMVIVSSERSIPCGLASGGKRSTAVSRMMPRVDKHDAAVLEVADNSRRELCTVMSRNRGDLRVEL